ncbi:hypothetical protein FACS189464_4200 [Bacteroidia bacterium]|nr:hypothetical protein FACS189464_4200 [Bacteroidia bacterium]
MDDLTGKVITSDMTEIGDFSCSDSLINRFQQNIQWTIRGNFIDVPTDCPTRDERMGWTGDLQLFSPTACFNVHAGTFIRKWLKDLTLDQLENGSVPLAVPDNISQYNFHAWSDAAIIVPWVIYQTYGDTRVLETQYASMKAWINYKQRESNNFFINEKQWQCGDWVAFSTNNYNYPGATTDNDFIATAYFAYISKLLSQTASVLKKEDDAKTYQQLFENIKKAFQKEYMTATGRLSNNTQTAYTLALAFDLVPDSLKQNLAQRLVDDVLLFGHITTGFLGNALICSILSEYGYDDIAYALLFRKEYPSWLYPVTRGATTVWERMNGIKTDGSFQHPDMNSFNTFAHGSVGYWLYSRVAGIRQESGSSGYKKIIIDPSVNAQMANAQAKFHSGYGDIVSQWEIKENQYNLKVVIPPNTTARIYIPAKNAKDITESGKPLSSIKGIKASTPVNGKIILETGSGEYHFSTALETQPFPEGAVHLITSDKPLVINAADFDLGGDMAFHKQKPNGSGIAMDYRRNGGDIYNYGISFNRKVMEFHHNSGYIYRDYGISFAEGLTGLGWTSVGDWYTYTVEVQDPGEYKISYCQGTPNDNSQAKLTIDGLDTFGIINVPRTGDWTTGVWSDINKTVKLSAGKHKLKWTQQNQIYNFYGIKFTYVGPLKNK